MSDHKQQIVAAISGVVCSACQLHAGKCDPGHKARCVGMYEEQAEEICKAVVSPLVSKLAAWKRYAEALEWELQARGDSGLVDAILGSPGSFSVSLTGLEGLEQIQQAASAVTDSARKALEDMGEL